MDLRLVIDPPLLNSSSPWATTLTDLQALYDCPFTGAITTRTSLINGFKNDPTRHQHCFFNAGTAARSGSATSLGQPVNATLEQNHGNSSLNTYGYSPLPLHEYLSYIKQLVRGENLSTTSHTDPISPPVARSKLIIVSVTGTPFEITTSYRLLSELHHDLNGSLRLAMEINLSCPNIAGKPPPAYDASSLIEYLNAVQEVRNTTSDSSSSSLPIPSGDDINAERHQVKVGIKLPPYTYQGQFDMVAECLRKVTSTSSSSTTTTTTTTTSSSSTSAQSPIDFITSTNTLGSSLVLDETTKNPALQSESGTGTGGMAGAAIHNLSLGNVSILSRLLKQHESTRQIAIIGVGGVSDHAGYTRMRSVGANAVGLATALGQQGLGVFEKVSSRH